MLRIIANNLLLTTSLLSIGCVTSVAASADTTTTAGVSATITITVNLQHDSHFPAKDLTQAATHQCAAQLNDSTINACDQLLTGYHITETTAHTLRIEPI